MNLTDTDKHAALYGKTALTFRRNTLVLFFFLLYIVGAHLRLSIYSGGSIVVPMYLMLLGSGVVGFLYISALATRSGVLFLIFAIFILIHPLLTSAPHSGVMTDLTGRAQLIVSVAGSLAIIFSLSNIERSALRKFVLLVWCVFVLLSVLESVALKPTFDVIRESLYAGGNRGIYDSAARDISIYGKIRPTALASEPSFLAETLGCLVLLIFLLGARRGSLRSWVELAMMIGISFVISPSFKLAFYLAAAFTWQFWPTSWRELLNFSAIIVAAMTVFIIFRQPLISVYFDIFGSHMDGGSYFGRVVVGPLVAGEAIDRFPLWGFGVANDTGLYPIVAGIWQSSGAFTAFPWYTTGGAKNLMSSGFYWQLAYLGIFGTLVFVILLRAMLGRIGVQLPLRSIVCTWIIWYGGAAFVDPWSWFPMAVFALASSSGALPSERVMSRKG